MGFHPSWRDGNLSRPEYWGNIFLGFLIVLGCMGVIGVLSKTDVMALQEGGTIRELSVSTVVIGIFYFTLLWNICRVRDFGYGWPTGLIFTIACLVPYIGLVILLILGFYPSKNVDQNVEAKNDEGKSTESARKDRED